MIKRSILRISELSPQQEGLPSYNIRNLSSSSFTARILERASLAATMAFSRSVAFARFSSSRSRHLSTQQPSWPFFPCSGNVRPVRPSALRPPLERPHHYSWLVPWLRQVPPEGSPQLQLHLQSQRIKDTSIMLLLLCVDHRRNHSPCAFSSRLLTSMMSASAASSCRFSLANSAVWLAIGPSATCT